MFNLISGKQEAALWTICTTKYSLLKQCYHVHVKIFQQDSSKKKNRKSFLPLTYNSSGIQVNLAYAQPTVQCVSDNLHDTLQDFLRIEVK